MSCRNMEKELYKLRRCGCDRCRSQHQQMYRNAKERSLENIGQYMTVPQDIGIDLAKVTDYMPDKPTQLKAEEPKNIAIKLLVDKLKAEQLELAATQKLADDYKSKLNVQLASKKSHLKTIKELSDALKKLGHKE